MSELAQDICLEGLTQSLTSLFEHYTNGEVDIRLLVGEEGLQSSELSEECQLEFDLASSTIELVGEGVRYFICLVSPIKTVRGLCDGGANDPVDWIGELANQLFGRFKNHLLEYGVDSQLGIPIASEGVQQKCIACGDGSSTLEIKTPAGYVWAVFKPEVDPDLCWERGNAIATSEEGSIELF
ncbi:hypothetical protein LOC67_00440 [Stieleria sp. JC731]|uniref:hypothetical protein n=1 Tax=Pirellulaceae TaxID=2691357 RepID=UPI001E2B01CF|nr:hypothetical protein [Stieleria sp. JC731]MCC9599008.1 hypothetical protein [Stieleria sp. JC731]